MTALLGRYELMRPLGQGGMAEVFLARYVGPEGFEKRLVIKKLLPQLADDRQLLRMFFEEAKTHVGLSHSNLVSVFDFGRVGNDYFIAMEHVDGADLGAVLTAERAGGGPLSPALVAYLGVEICRGLSYVHRRGFVHRDVSPRNVLLSSDGEAKLSDFGLVLSQASAVSGIRGTLAYIAPEQARGERVDGRADLYSLGVVLAEAATGRRLREAADQMRALALAQSPEPLAIEGPLGEIVARATQGRPEARYADADEMLAALERVASLLGEGRESSLRALAAKVRAAAPHPDTPEPAPLPVEPATATGTVPPSPTANYRGESPALRETYFRDQASRSFVEEVLEPAAPAPQRSRRRLALFAASLLAAVALLSTQPRPQSLAPPPSPSPSPPPSPSLNPSPLPNLNPSPLPNPSLNPPPSSSLPLPPAPRATLIVLCTPWCVPSVDGRPRGHDGRRHQLSLSPGPHRVLAQRLDDRLERSVKLRSGETQTIELEFP